MKARSKEHKKKLSEAQSILWLDPEYRKSQLEAIRKINRQGENNPHFGKHHSEEAKKAISKGKKGQRPWLGKKHSERAKEKNRLKHLGKKHSEETKHKNAEISRKRWQDPVLKKKMIETCKRNWQNAEFKEKHLKAILKGNQVKPNKAELKLNAILQSILPNEYALNVKGDIMILGGKIPDFVNTNGQKKIIEMFGDYWHTKRINNYLATEKGRIEYFRKLGWDTLIIWESELRDLKELSEKLLKFKKGDAL